MVDEQDFRTKKMESREGRGYALERRRQWEDAIPPKVLRLAFSGQDINTLDGMVGEETADEFRDRWRSEVKDRSDLIGFWVSWHLAGGFHALELGGWNRATLYRKLKQFRVTFGAHPDEFEFEYLKLDVEKAWLDDLMAGL